MQYDLINELDFTVPPLQTEDTSIIGEFDGKNIFNREIVEEINKLPFKDKLYFSNTSTRPLQICHINSAKKLRQAIQHR